MHLNLCGDLFFAVCILVGSQITMAQTISQLDHDSAGGYFARTWPTAACENAKDPQSPSIERSANGDLLLLFTCAVTGQQQPVLALSVSEDEGRTWSQQRVIHRGGSGTLTRLWMGKLMAPVVEAGVVRLLVSEDNGQTWQTSAPINSAPLREASPYSRIVQTPAGLLMPIYGKLDVGDMIAPCSGLLRSTDGGKTWGDFTEIGCDREAGKIKFGPVAVCSDTDRRLVAMISVDDNRLYRSVSNDAGQTWSKPRQRLVASHPALAHVGSTLACVNQIGGFVRVKFSDSLFDS